MLRRDLGELTEFLTVTLWESLDAVRAFAGDDYETAVFYPEDERFLVERDERCTYYLEAIDNAENIATLHGHSTHVQEVADAVDGAVLDASKRRAEEAGDLRPKRLCLCANHREHGLADRRRLLGIEGPLDQCRKLDSEQRVHILERALDGAGHTRREERLA